MTKEQIRKFTVLGALMTLWSDTLEQDISEVISFASQIEIQRLAVGVDVTDEELLEIVREMLIDALRDALTEEGAQTGEVTAEYDEAASE